MGMSDKNSKLPNNVRIMLGIFAMPSLYLAYMVGSMALNGDYQKVDYFEWIYSLIGILAFYIAITGKRVF